MKLGSLPINLRHVGIFVVIGVIVIILMNFNQRLETLTGLQEQAKIVEEKGTAVMMTQEVLSTLAAQATSPASAEEYARSEAYMAQPGDQVFVIVPETGITPTPTPMPTPIVDTRTKWNIWMDFIFGQ